MSNEENVFSKFNLVEKIKSNKVLKIIIICLLCLGLIFILFFDKIVPKSEDIDAETTYIEQLEKKLEKTLSKVEGAGEVSVIISLKSGTQTVLAMKTTIKETSNGIEREETPIIVNGKTVILKEVTPEISGVLIVAKGADNIMVKSRLVNATKALLDIESNKIEILTMK